MGNLLKLEPETLSAPYFNSHIDILVRMGWARDDQLKILDLDSTFLLDPRNRIKLIDATRLYTHAAEMFDEPNIGLLIGHKFRVATFVETGSVLSYAKNLAHAAEINRKYEPLAHTAGICSLIRDSNRIFLQWDPAFHSDNQYRHFTEIIFAGYAATIRWLAWVYDKDIKALFFKHDQPQSLKAYAEVLQCPVHFGQSHNRLEFHAETVDLSLPTSNPEKMKAVSEQLDKILTGTAEKSPLEQSVRGAIRKALSNQDLSFQAVASILGTPERSLRHNLKKSNLAYRDIVDSVRKSMFDQLLQLGKPLTETAQVLGYSDQSAFTRAFRRWHGISPSAYKANKIDF